MNELEKLREENKALKIMIKAQEAFIENMEKAHQAEIFMKFHQGGHIQKGEFLYGGVVMPAERKNLTITINEDGTISKTEE